MGLFTALYESMHQEWFPAYRTIDPISATFFIVLFLTFLRSVWRLLSIMTTREEMVDKEKSS
jgi:hypothetical protein